jgi:hypothetical protein
MTSSEKNAQHIARAYFTFKGRIAVLKRKQSEIGAKIRGYADQKKLEELKKYFGKS